MREGCTSPELFALNGDIQHNPLPVDDPKQRRPDIPLAKKLLGWEPQVELERGLQRTIEYFRNKV